jgi:hypothetical protein
MRLLPLLCTTLFASALAAQGSIISPIGTATVEGSGSNSFPFSSTVARRYLQIHGDLGSTPLLITQLSFRMNVGTTNWTGTRTFDLELYMGDGVSPMAPSMVYDNNYLAPKTTVIPRSFITWGPQGQAVSPGPNAFTSNMDLTLPTPFVYTGVNPLVWEVAHFSQTSSGTLSVLDVDGSSTLTATSTITGTGCIATGQTAAMTHTYAVNDSAGTLTLNGTITAGPANSLAIMAIGFTNPNLAFPGLCGVVYTDAAITQVLGFTTATGTFTADTPTGAIILPNVLTGVALYTQAFAVDLGLAFPIQFACSNGRVSTVPAPQLGHVNQVTRLWNNAGGTTTTTAFCSPTTIVGYGLPVRFSYL